MTPPATIAEVLTNWIKTRGNGLNPRANELGVGWDTLRNWANGTRLPKKRDLPAIACAVGMTLDELTELRWVDYQARLAAAGGVRVDSPDEARAWAAANTPAATGEDGGTGAADGVHGAHNAQPVGA